MGALLACGACRFHAGEAPPADGGPDAPPLVDAGPVTTARTAHEIVGGGGRVTAGSITIDVQIGQGVALKKSTAGTVTLQGAPALTP